MAKDDKGRIRVFFAEFEGSSDTLQESIRALTGAVQRTFDRPPPQVKLLQVAPNASDEEVTDAIAEATENGAADATEPAVASRGSNPKPRKSPPKYNLLGNLELRPEGVQSLRDFVAERQLESDQERITAFVYWMQHLGNIQKIGIDHIFTCYDEVGKPSPTNIGQIVTNTKKRTGWITGSKNDISVTVTGGNFVKHDSLKRKEAD